MHRRAESDRSAAWRDTDEGRTSPMIAADVTSTLDPVAPAIKRHTSIAAVFLARAVPSVKSVNVEKDTRNTGRRPYISDSGACEKSVRRSRRKCERTHPT